jgi:hypothetical protein
MSGAAGSRPAWRLSFQNAADSCSITSMMGLLVSWLVAGMADLGGGSWVSVLIADGGDG